MLYRFSINFIASPYDPIMFWEKIWYFLFINHNMDNHNGSHLYKTFWDIKIIPRKRWKTINEYVLFLLFYYLVRIND